MLVTPFYNAALVVSIAVGVGLAAVVGTLRMTHGWPLSRVVYITLAVVLSLTAAVEESDVKEITGMAWDSGAVTTGCVLDPRVAAGMVGVVLPVAFRNEVPPSPSLCFTSSPCDIVISCVTVPLVLSLGIGILTSVRNKVRTYTCRLPPHTLLPCSQTSL